MVGNVAALARQVLDFAASVVRYTAVKNVRATRSLTVRGSIFGDNSICPLPRQLALRLDHAIMVPRPCNGNRGRKERWSCRESNPFGLWLTIPVLSMYGMCGCWHDMCGRYVFMSLNKKWASVERLDVALEQVVTGCFSSKCLHQQ